MAPFCSTRGNNRPLDGTQLQAPAVMAVPAPVVNAPFLQVQVPVWKTQHPVDAPLAANCVPH
jgi:hypothetical protein